MPKYILHESALGYALFKKQKNQEIGGDLNSVQRSLAEFKNFSTLVKLVSFVPFEDPIHSLANMNAVVEGRVHEFLESFLEANLSGKKKVKLGVADNKLGGSIKEALGIDTYTKDSVIELGRGITTHLHKFLKTVKPEDVDKSRLGLGHTFSRFKVKFNLNKVDNMIIQSICLLDQMDKDINTFVMRLKEWYGWHFPELTKVAGDIKMYPKLVLFIKDKKSISKDSLDGLTKITKSEEISENIIQAARSSFGIDLSEFDLLNIEMFAKRVDSLTNYKEHLYDYLSKKMHAVAPNLSVLAGEIIGARLISHAGSLTNLAKVPASTVQILGAEKALFRALKVRGKTPKYGLIYHSPFIGKATKQNKGRISRYFANKCSIATRLDAFSDVQTTKFGEMLKKQVEERLNYYEKGVKDATLKKNVDLMKEVISSLAVENLKRKREAPKEETVVEAPPKKKTKKEKEETDDMEVEQSKEEKKAEKKKNKKKNKKKKKEKKEEKKEEKKVEKKKKKEKKEEKKVEKKEKKEKKKRTKEEKAERKKKKKEKKDKKNRKEIKKN